MTSVILTLPKACPAISSRPSFRVREVREVQPEKALMGMYLTPPGMLSSAALCQLPKEFDSMVVSEAGSAAPGNAVQ